MIDIVHIENFKAHSNTEVPLGRLTMLVGDNASGKTSVLEALWIMGALGESTADVLRGDLDPEDLLKRGAPHIRIRCRGTSKAPGRWRNELIVTRQIHASFGAGWRVSLEGDQPSGAYRAECSMGEGGRLAGPSWDHLKATNAAGMYRLRAKQVAAVAVNSAPNPKIEEDGTNTAAVLANLKLGADEVYERIERDMRALIPSVRRVRIRQQHLHGNNQGPVGPKVFFDFAGADGVPAHGASQGTLLVLSLLTVLHGPHRPNLILLDDFDHALHPRAQMELIRLLKQLLTLPELSQVQIVATTHSPYILDELTPADIHAFALREDGSVASKRLSDHPDAAKTSGTLSAGQLWSLDSEKSWILGR